MPIHALAALTKTLSYAQEEVYLKREHGRAPRREYETKRIPLIVPMGQAGYAFPSGLVHRAVAALQQAGIADVALDGLDAPPAAVDIQRLPNGTQLYDDQLLALAALLKGGRGIAALAPNFGKTEVIAGILSAYPQATALVLDSSRARVDQAAGRLATLLGETVHRFEGAKDYRRARVTVSTIQTLSRALESPHGKRLLASQMLLVDEVHAVSPRQWFPALGACTAPLRIGLTGSARDVAAPLVMEAFFGPVLYEATEEPLIESGRSARSEVFMPYVGSMVRETADYADVYEQAVVHSADRNAVIARAIALCFELGLPSVTLFYRLDHGVLLERACFLAGVPAAALRRLDGKSHPHAVEEAKRLFLSGHLKVLIASGIFNQGIDLATMRVLINAAAWKSALATGQKLGRAARRKIEVLDSGDVIWGDNRALVIDPFDLGNRTLKRHSQARERTYTKKGSPVRQGTWGEIEPLIRDWAAAGALP